MRRGKDTRGLPFDMTPAEFAAELKRNPKFRKAVDGFSKAIERVNRALGPITFEELVRRAQSTDFVVAYWPDPLAKTGEGWMIVKDLRPALPDTQNEIMTCWAPVDSKATAERLKTALAPPANVQAI